MRRLLFGGLIALLVLSGACAGRSIRGGADEENGGASAVAGTDASSGGTSNTGVAGRTGSNGGRAGHGSGGTLNRAGAGGAIGVAGSIAEAGAPLCGGCDPIACGTGFRPVLDPDGCCFHCECSPMFCPLVACPSGSHLEARPGQCCPTCLQDDCAEQRASYRDFENQLVEKYSYGCKTAKDCSVYYDKNPCGTACGVVVATENLENLRSNLEGYSQQNCSNQCAGPTPPCDPPAVITCAQGRCQ